MIVRTKWGRCLFFLTFWAFIPLPAALAQGPDGRGAEPSPAETQAPAGVDPALAVALIRDVLAAVNHANWTGNYTVLQNYASPGFGEANDPTRLTAIFQPIRAAGLDLFPALVVNPVVQQNMIMPEQRQLLLTGYFPTQPRQILFELLFEPVGDRWRLFGVAIAPRDTQPAAGARNSGPPAVGDLVDQPGIPTPEERPEED